MKSLSRLFVLFTACCTLFTAQLAHAEDCQPSPWGPEDEIGAANYVSPEQVLMAAKLIKKGQSHPLGIVIDPAMPSL